MRVLRYYRTVFWFHPAVWWLLSRIHLAREQSVDREVVRLTGSRQPYLDSLLEIARMRGRPKAVPATLFLRERHLVERVALLIKEVSMNRLRLVLSLGAAFILLAGTVQFAAAWFPLTGNAESGTNANQNNTKRVGSNILSSNLIHKVEPVLPEHARKTSRSGTIGSSHDKEGHVSNVAVLNGKPVLSESAVAAVRQWQFAPILKNGISVPVTSTVQVSFAFPETSTPPQQAGAIPLQPGNFHTVGIYRSDSLGGAVSYSAGLVNADLPPSTVYQVPQLSFNYESLLPMAHAGWPNDVDTRQSLVFSSLLMLRAQSGI